MSTGSSRDPFGEEGKTPTCDELADAIIVIRDAKTPWERKRAQKKHLKLTWGMNKIQLMPEGWEEAEWEAFCNEMNGKRRR